MMEKTEEEQGVNLVTINTEELETQQNLKAGQKLSPEKRLEKSILTWCFHVPLFHARI
jgi:hypothetical protein